MAIRGSNPVWSFVDLTGHQFDDTFYMFVLQNHIPYIPEVVWHDPQAQIPWTNPIQFLANGTLPIDIYWDDATVYRLEFRKGPTQSDPLIYEVNNYIPGSGGDEPIDSVGLVSSNQITNPQFSIVDFSESFTISATDPDPIRIGPGWYLELSGTGSVTINRVSLNNSNENPSNAPYALQLTLTGWNPGEVFLRQRFYQNGMLWAKKIVSSAITARINGSPQSISGTLIDSNNSVLSIVFPSTPIVASFNEFTGYGSLPDTTNPNLPPAAFIDYKVSLPNNVDIYITSLQLIVQDLPAKPSFDQDSINRQIDHTYNSAYPIIPVGTIIDYAGFGSIDHYLFCDGAAYSRRNYKLLFDTITITETVSLTNASPAFTVADASQYWIGMAIEGQNIPASTTIINIVGNTITMSANASLTGPSVVRFFSCGAGDGSTTFNVYDLREYVTAGAGGSLFGAVNKGFGYKGGASTHALTIAEMPAHNHTGSTVQIWSTSGIGVQAPQATARNTLIGNFPLDIASQGGSQAHSIVQKTVLMKKFIRYE